MAGALLPQVAGGDATQLRLHPHQQLISGLAIAPPPVQQERRDRLFRHPPGSISELFLALVPLNRVEDRNMTPERFRQVRNVFEAALEKAPSARADFLAEAAASDADLRAQVERMLEAHGNTVTFLDGALAAPEELRTDPHRMEGRRLGPYEVLREIGRGGMGTVYLARRADGLFEQQVAIKVVTPESAGREVIERFAQE